MLNGGKPVDHCAAAFAALMRSDCAFHLRVNTRSYALPPHTRLESHRQSLNWVTGTETQRVPRRRDRAAIAAAARIAM